MGETRLEIQDNCGRKGMKGNGVCGGFYGLVFLGTAGYNIIHATSFWVGVLGFLKAIVWPIFLIYKVMEILNM